jgi:hypothetical protein
MCEASQCFIYTSHLNKSYGKGVGCEQATRQEGHRSIYVIVSLYFWIGLHLSLATHHIMV